MKDLVGNQFDDIEAAINNSEINITLNTARSGDRQYKNKDERLDLKKILDNKDEKNNDLEEEKISQPNNALTTHCFSDTYNIPIYPAFFPLPIQTLGLIHHKSGVISDLTEELK